MSKEERISVYLLITFGTLWITDWITHLDFVSFNEVRLSIMWEQTIPTKHGSFVSFIHSRQVKEPYK